MPGGHADAPAAHSNLADSGGRAVGQHHDAVRQQHRFIPSETSPGRFISACARPTSFKASWVRCFNCAFDQALRIVNLVKYVVADAKQRQPEGIGSDWRFGDDEGARHTAVSN